MFNIKKKNLTAEVTKKSHDNFNLNQVKMSVHKIIFLEKPSVNLYIDGQCPFSNKVDLMWDQYVTIFKVNATRSIKN